MGFFKRMKRINGAMRIELDEPEYHDGDTVTGTVLVNVRENFRADEITINYVMIEEYAKRVKKPKTVETQKEVGIFKIPKRINLMGIDFETTDKETVMEEVTVKGTEHLHGGVDTVSGPVDIEVGEHKFPFNIMLPSLFDRWTNPESEVNLKLNGKMSISKRPEMITQVTIPLFAPAKE
jgi:hypothetical protein